MRFEREFQFDDLMNVSFIEYMELIKKKYPDEQVIGYRATKHGGVTDITVTFSKREDEDK